MTLPKITLTEAQNHVLGRLKNFITKSNDRVFVLKGYAGTGKTTLVRFLIPYLEMNEIQYKLLATTGRAAKVLSNYTGYEAKTIHSMIYNFQDLNQDLSEVNEQTELDSTGQLYLNFEAVQMKSETACIYIVDESSMISDEETVDVVQAKFGSGRLLAELLEYDTNPDSKYIFIGDPCQLPPITSTISPALSPSYIKSTFHVGVQEVELTQIMRQNNDNDIIYTASLLRNLYSRAPENKFVYGNNVVWGTLPFAQRKNILVHNSPQQLVDSYFRKLLTNGHEHTIYIARSNRQCMQISNMVRTGYGFKQCICVGDLLMVIQNQMTTGLMNGDFVEVLHVGQSFYKTFYLKKMNNSLITINFIEVRVKECFTKQEFSTLLITDTLVQGNNLTPIQQSGLFLDFAIRMKLKGITQRKRSAEFNDAMTSDPFLNALRCSYGYAVTCHKAQGGEWEDVFVDIPRNFTLNPTKETYQWMYTALTRAKSAFHCVNDFYIK